MKKTKNTFGKILLLLSIVFFSYSEAKAQESPAINTGNYRTAIGLRAGYTSGLTIKHFMSSGSAIEGIIGAWPNAFSITGLYELHRPTTINGLKWYYGLGAHATFYSSRYYYHNHRGEHHGHHNHYYRYEGDGAGVGIDGILGLEYKIPPIPFALSLDIKPMIEFNTTNSLFYTAFDPGLGIKFTF